MDFIASSYLFGKAKNGRGPERLLQLLHADVKRAALLVPVHNQSDRFMTVPDASERAEICCAFRTAGNS